MIPQPTLPMGSVCRLGTLSTKGPGPSLIRQVLRHVPPVPRAGRCSLGTLRRRPWALAILVVAALCLGTASPSPAASPKIASSWRVVATYDDAPQVLNAVACPAVSMCEAVGNGIAQITDGGRSWVKQAHPVDRQVFDAIACPSVERCVAGGIGGIIGTTDGGRVWREQHIATKTSGIQISGIACRSVTACEAVGFEQHANSPPPIVVRTTDGGQVWSFGQLPLEVGTPAAISCPSVRECFVVGSPYNNGIDAAVTTDGGTHWKAERLPAGVVNLESITCPTSLRCEAVGLGTGQIPVLLETDDAGVSWQPRLLPANTLVLTSISCVSDTSCAAVGNEFVATTQDDWSTDIVHMAPGAQAVSCVAVSACVVVGRAGDNRLGLISWSHDGGSTWVPTVDQSAIANLSGVACPAKAQCIVVGDDLGGGAVVLQSEEATRWMPVPAAEPLPGLFSVTCPSPHECLAVGAGAMGSGGSSILRSTDGGRSWTFGQVPSNSTGISTISCSSVPTCEAPTAHGVMATTDGGAHWVVQRLPLRNSAYMAAVSCPSTTTCQAVAALGETMRTVDGGQDWVRTRPIGPMFLIDPAAMTCTSMSSCVIVGAGGVVRTTDGGRSWRLPLTVPPTTMLDAVDCPSANICYAVGADASAASVVGTKDGGKHWTVVSRLPHVRWFSSIACDSTTRCVATGYDKQGIAVLVKGS